MNAIVEQNGILLYIEGIGIWNGRILKDKI